MTSPLDADEVEQTLPIDELLALSEISEEDIVEALIWWDETASDTWKGVLDEQG